MKTEKSVRLDEASCKCPNVYSILFSGSFLALKPRGVYLFVLILKT